MKTIRLLAPIRVGHEIHPNNAVFDAEDAVADELLTGKDGKPCAEETDAIERHPTGQPLRYVSDFPVSGAEKFPLDPEAEPTVTPAMFTNEADARVESRIKAAGPVPVTLSKEPAPAKIEVTAKMRKAEKEDAVNAVVEDAPPVVVVEDPKSSKDAKKG